MDSSSGATIATPQWDWGETNRAQSAITAHPAIPYIIYLIALDE